MSGVDVFVDDPVRGVHADISVSDGERVALVGRNGAGKSTLLNSVAGLYRPGKRGTVRVSVGGHDVSGAALHERGVASLSQSPALFEHLSVLSNAMYGPVSRGLARSTAREQARSILARMGIEDLEQRSARDLSGGQSQKVALARALASEPSAVLLDEPLSALDVNAAEDMRDMVTHMTRDRTLLFVTHDVLDLGAWADRVIHLERGRVEWDGTASELGERPANDFLASLTGRVWVRGYREARQSFVSDSGVRLPVRPNESLTGPVMALVDPSVIRTIPAPGHGTSQAREDAETRIARAAVGIHSAGRVSRVGATTVQWIDDVPVLQSSGGVGGRADVGLVRLDPTAAVTLVPRPVEPQPPVSPR